MIKRIFFDLDETLLHTHLGRPPVGVDYVTHPHTYGGTMEYHTVFRPCANELISFARDLVGHENVYVLTAATRDYARFMNEAGKFGFDHDQIFSREDIRNNSYSSPGMYGSFTMYVKHPGVADPMNVLIDNLHSRENESKMTFIDIQDLNRYIQVQNFYGTNMLGLPDETKSIKDKLSEIHSV
jgi:hypothetical protein